MRGWQEQSGDTWQIGEEDLRRQKSYFFNGESGCQYPFEGSDIKNVYCNTPVLHIVYEQVCNKNI